MTRHILVERLFLLVVGSVVGFTACQQGPDRQLKMAPASVLPEFAQTAPPVVQEAYRFAVANPEVLSVIPCYCGCGRMGHTSNLGCYVRYRADGSIEFDNHAFG